MTAACLALLLVPPAIAAAPGFTYPSQTGGGVTARLAVRVDDRGPGPGRAQATLSITVAGPAALEVESPRREDALDAWKVEWAASSWSQAHGRTSVEQTLQLVQVKPGVVPLPGLVLRARAGPAAAWEEFLWPELLLEPRDPPPPDDLPPPPASVWPRRLLWAAGALTLVVAGVLLFYAGLRVHRALRRPAALHERALARLADAPADPLAAVGHTDRVLRGYLEDRFGVPAPQQTHQELLAALAQRDALSAEQLTRLTALLSQSDLLKFARIEGPEAIAQLRAEAEAFIRTTATIGEGKKTGEACDSGEKRAIGEAG
jgi:hypothetical protein